MLYLTKLLCLCHVFNNNNNINVHFQYSITNQLQTELTEQCCILAFATFFDILCIVCRDSSDVNPIFGPISRDCKRSPSCSPLSVKLNCNLMEKFPQFQAALCALLHCYICILSKPQKLDKQSSKKNKKTASSHNGAGMEIAPHSTGQDNAVTK